MEEDQQRREITPQGGPSGWLVMPQAYRFLSERLIFAFSSPVPSFMCSQVTTPVQREEPPSGAHVTVTVLTLR